MEKDTSLSKARSSSDRFSLALEERICKLIERLKTDTNCSLKDYEEMCRRIIADRECFDGLERKLWEKRIILHSIYNNYMDIKYLNSLICCLFDF